MEATRFSEKLVDFQRTMMFYISEDRTLLINHCTYTVGLRKFILLTFDWLLIKSFLDVKGKNLSLCLIN
jgi:hypothetical protein